MMSLFVYDDGKVKSCCAGMWDWGDLKEKSLDEIINDPKVIQLKQDILDGKPNDYCNYCSGCEANSGHSQRFYFHKFKISDEELADPTKFDLRMTDIRWNNLCNLNCAYCDTLWSTTWMKAKGYEIKSIKSRYYDSVLLAVQNNKNVMEAIIMGGGEPLLHKQNVELLQSLDDHIDIDIMTNLSIDLNSSSVYQELKKKVNVNWCISFENLGDEFEFVRHGAKWEQLLTNIATLKTHPTHRFMFKPTYNLLSATRLTELYKLSEEFNIPIFWQTLIHPAQLCVAKLPKHVIQTCLTYLREFTQSEVWNKYKEMHSHQHDLDFFDGIINELQGKLDDASHNGNMAQIQFIEWLDLYENKYATDVRKFTELWPEFASLKGVSI
jgi:uncharacterized Fe-S cluster-containing radical SAM superfamily protein